MVLRPVGDLPPSVYWVRRLVVVVALVVIAAVVWLLWPSGDDGNSPTAAEPTSTPSKSATTTSSTPEPSASSTKTKNEEPTKPECSNSDIDVTVSTDAQRYGPDEQPAITFAVENVSNDACSRDIGQGANELQITSGGVQIWSSDDCNPGGEEDLDNLQPGDRFVQTVTWPRIESAEGCPTPQEEAPSGTYQVIARNGDARSEPAAFVLE